MVDRFQHIFDSLTEEVVVLDHDLRIVYANSAWLDRLGLTSSKALGRTCHDLLLNKGTACASEMCAAQQAFDDGHPVRLTCQGMERAPLLSASPILNSAGQVAEIALVAHYSDSDTSQSPPASAEVVQRAERLAVINRISLAVSSTLELDQILQTAAREMANVFDVRQTGIILFEPDLSYGRVAAEFQETPDQTGADVRIPLADNPSMQRVMATKQPLAIADARRDPLTSTIRDVVEMRNIESILIVPLVFKGEVIGTIGLDAIDTPRVFTSDEIGLAETIANQVVVAIDNAQLFAAEAQRRREAETLQAATQAISTTLDLQTILELILSELQQVVPYDSASVQQLEGDTLKIIGGYGFANLDELLGLRFDLEATNNPNRDVLHSRAPLILRDAPSSYQQFQREPHSQAGIRSWLGVPLLFGDRPIGMLALDKKEPEAFGPRSGKK